MISLATLNLFEFVVNTCSIFSGTNAWLPVNLILVLMGFAVISLIYAVGSMVPRARSVIPQLAKAEITQLILSLIIIMVLATTVVSVCNISAATSKSLTGTKLDQFQFANYYIGNLTFGTGLGLLSNIYASSIQLYITGQVYNDLWSVLNTVGVTGLVNKVTSLFTRSAFLGALSQNIVTSTQPGIVFSLIGDVYIGVFGTVVVVAVTFLLTQWIFIILIEYLAFMVVLPAGLILRVVVAGGAGGPGLRQVANLLIALSIALYIVYPMTIAFDAYAVHWIFSSSNPSYQYLGYTYTLPNINPGSSFFAISPCTSSSPTAAACGSSPAATAFGLTTPTLAAFTTNFYQLTITNILFHSLGTIFGSYAYLPQQIQIMTNQVAEFLFVSLVMFGLDLTITFAFAISLAKALTAGVENEMPFWGNL